MREYENFCVGCETCINCGNKEDKLVITCDCCGDLIEDKFYDFEGKDLCYKCIANKFHEDDDEDDDEDTKAEIDADIEAEIEMCLTSYDEVVKEGDC